MPEPLQGRDWRRNRRQSRNRCCSMDRGGERRISVSFNSICDALGINARALRKALDLWLASGSRLARRTPVTQQTIKPQTPNGRRGRAGKRHTKNYLYREMADDALRRSDPLVAG